MASDSDFVLDSDVSSDFVRDDPAVTAPAAAPVTRLGARAGLKRSRTPQQLGESGSAAVVLVIGDHKGLHAGHLLPQHI